MATAAMVHSFASVPVEADSVLHVVYAMGAVAGTVESTANEQRGINKWVGRPIQVAVAADPNVKDDALQRVADRTVGRAIPLPQDRIGQEVDKLVTQALNRLASKAAAKRNVKAVSSEGKLQMQPQGTTKSPGPTKPDKRAVEAVEHKRAAEETKPPEARNKHGEVEAKAAAQEIEARRTEKKEHERRRAERAQREPAERLPELEPRPPRTEHLQEQPQKTRGGDEKQSSNTASLGRRRAGPKARRNSRCRWSAHAPFRAAPKRSSRGTH